MAVEPSKGTVPLQVLEGREPMRPGEIALGTATLRKLGKQIGDTVTIILAPGQPPQRLRVVGRLVLSAGPLDTAIAPGKGAVINFEMARRLAPEGVEVAPEAFLVRVDPAADPSRTVETLQRAFPGHGGSSAPTPRHREPPADHLPTRPACRPGRTAGAGHGDPRPGQLGQSAPPRSGRAQDPRLPAPAGVGHSRLAGHRVRHRGRTGRPPTGGRHRSLGVAACSCPARRGPRAIVPPHQVLAVVGGAFLAVNLIAVGPGWVAGRLRPALVLRSE
jgi:hypothetical protein